MIVSEQSQAINHFILPEVPPPSGYFWRYLAPIAPNVLDAYCETYCVAGGVVLDPFPRGDAVARAASRTSRKAILSDSNALSAFAARASMLVVTGQDLLRAFSRLSDGKVGKVSLASYLDGLYATKCPTCGGAAVITEVRWDRGLDAPVTKRVACASCHGANGVASDWQPTEQEDFEALHQVDARGPHFDALARRVTAGGPGESDLVAPLLDLYTPRAALALFTLLQRIESSSEGPNVRQVLKLCLLECLCACTRLETDPPLPARGEEIDLQPAATYLERNPWRLFCRAYEEAKRRLEARGGDKQAPRLAASVDRFFDADAYGRLGNPPNAIVLEEAARTLGRGLPECSVDLVLCEPPGPSDGPYLCLSYLWSGWLFGNAKLQGLEQLPCTTRPVDWPAYYRAMGAAVRGLLPVLKERATVVFLCQARHHRQLEMLLLAPLAAGLVLRRILLQPGDEARYVIEFARPSESESQALQEVIALDSRLLEVAMRHETDEAMREVLQLRAEPTDYLWLQTAVMERLGATGVLLALLERSDFDAQRVADIVHREAAEALERGRRKGHLLRQDLPRLMWSPARMSASSVGLSDRVELAVYHHLSTNRRTTAANARRVVHALFPGLATPEPGWIDDCLVSYGRQEKGDAWSLAPQEAIPRRADDHTQAVAVLAELGHRFGLNVWIAREEQKRPHGQGTAGQLLSVAERYASPANFVGGSQAADVDVIWYDGGASIWLFEVEWSAAFSQATIGRRLPAKARRFLVVADERIDLVERKLTRFSWLRPALENDGWRFLTWSSLAIFATREKARIDDLEKVVGLRHLSGESQD